MEWDERADPDLHQALSKVPTVQGLQPENFWITSPSPYPFQPLIGHHDGLYQDARIPQL